MNEQKILTSNETARQSDADIFREKAKTYILCFLSNCPLRNSCLRYLVGEYGEESPLVQLAINPHNPKVGRKGCPMYRGNERKLMKFGFQHLYYDMPGHMEQSIRRTLIARLGRKQYFEMRKGERPITPSHQEVIAQVCRAHGWTGSINYDGERVEYEW